MHSFRTTTPKSLILQYCQRSELFRAQNMALLCHYFAYYSTFWSHYYQIIFVIEMRHCWCFFNTVIFYYARYFALTFTLERNCAKIDVISQRFFFEKEFTNIRVKSDFLLLPKGLFPPRAPSQKGWRLFRKQGKKVVEKEKRKLFCSGQKVSQSLKLALL